MSPTLIALTAFAVLGVLHFVVPWLLLRSRRRSLQQVCRQRRVVALTFDDGPSRVLTPLVVDRLTKAGVPGTFFVLGERLEHNTEVVKGLVAAGHQIGSHGCMHVHHVWSWPWDGVLDTWAGWRAVRRATGLSPDQIPFRPPYGKLNLLSLVWVLWNRAPIAMWTHDGGDARDSVRLASTELVDEVRQAGGGVVLMHDFDRSMPDEGQQVLAKLDAVLQLKREGFSFARVSDLLPARA